VTREIVVLPDPAAVAAAAADRIVAAGRNAIRRRGIFRFALSGGATPLSIYPLLLSPPRVEAVDWSRVEFFWGDERCVPPHDPESNYGAAKAAFLDLLPGVRDDAVHRMAADRQDLDAAAADYQEEIARAFGLPVKGPRRPSFDLIWLGMGRDGHTASLFPESTALAERRRWVVGTWAPGPACWRMTLTFPILNAAREALFVVWGADKAVPFRFMRRWTGRTGTAEAPASRVRARRTLWLVDAAAAGVRQ
jgi:6-phosphogluconolactonase